MANTTIKNVKIDGEFNAGKLNSLIRDLPRANRMEWIRALAQTIVWTSSDLAREEYENARRTG